VPSDGLFVQPIEDADKAEATVPAGESCVLSDYIVSTARNLALPSTTRSGPEIWLACWILIVDGTYNLRRVVTTLSGRFSTQVDSVVLLAGKAAVDANDLHRIIDL